MNSKTRNKLKAAEEWTPFLPAKLPPVTAEELARRTGFSVEKIQACLDDQGEERVFLNNLYQVNITPCKDSPEGMPLLHVSIKRRDKEAVHDWRHFQRIKNELVGPECEAVELFPAESRLVDGANQYHLWAIATPGIRFPIGFDSGRMVGNVGPIGGKQRPGGYEETEKP